MSEQKEMTVIEAAKLLQAYEDSKLGVTLYFYHHPVSINDLLHAKAVVDAALWPIQKIAGFIDDVGEDALPLLSQMMAGEDMQNNVLNVCICDGEHSKNIPKLKDLIKSYRVNVFYKDKNDSVQPITNLITL